VTTETAPDAAACRGGLRDASFDPPHAVPTAHGRYYCDPGSPDGALLVSVTNVLDQLAKPHLIQAAATHTAEWAAERVPEAVRAADPGELAEFVRRARLAYRDTWNERADLGSRAHRLAEAHNLGAPIAPDPHAQPFLASYQRWLADFGIDVATDVVAAECTVLHRRLGYAGTSDLWVNLRFGRTSSLTRSAALSRASAWEKTSPPTPPLKPSAPPATPPGTMGHKPHSASSAATSPAGVMRRGSQMPKTLASSW
jgi:hypothetical protein